MLTSRSKAPEPKAHCCVLARGNLIHQPEWRQQLVVGLSEKKKDYEFSGIIPRSTVHLLAHCHKVSWYLVTYVYKNTMPYTVEHTVGQKRGTPSTITVENKLYRQSGFYM
jgi:hypothetical protein